VIGSKLVLKKNLSSQSVTTEIVV